MSRQLDELLELDGSSILHKVEIYSNGKYPSTFFIAKPSPLMKGLNIKNENPWDLEPMNRREFHLIKEYKNYALYQEIRRRIK